MNGATGGNELNRHMAGVAPHRPGDRDRRDVTEPTWADRAPAGLQGVPASLARRTRDDPMMAFLIAGSIGYGLGWLTALSRSTKPQPLPDYARKRA